jgi:hypothetical protein
MDSRLQKTSPHLSGCHFAIAILASIRTGADFFLSFLVTKSGNSHVHICVHACMYALTKPLSATLAMMVLVCGSFMTLCVTAAGGARQIQGHVLLTASWEAIVLLGALTLMAWLAQGAAFVVCVLVLAGWCLALLVKGTPMAHRLGKPNITSSHVHSADASAGTRADDGNMSDNSNRLVRVRRRHLAAEGEDTAAGGQMQGKGGYIGL